MSRGFRLAQNGFVRSYALAVLSGAALLLLAVLAVNFS
jgi:NADH-quinone oxidoreductase subunit L